MNKCKANAWSCLMLLRPFLMPLDMRTSLQSLDCHFIQTRNPELARMCQISVPIPDVASDWNGGLAPPYSLEIAKRHQTPVVREREEVWDDSKHTSQPYTDSPQSQDCCCVACHTILWREILHLSL